MEVTQAVEDRTQFIGASEVGAILGHDPYKTALQVYEEKVGLVLPFTGNAHTRRGTRLEEIAAEEYAAKTGKRLHRVHGRLQHPVYPFLTGKIDRRVVGERALAEIKCPSLGAFSKIKRTGLHEGYIAQMQTYLGLAGFEVGYWVIFCADQMEVVDFPVEFDPELYTQIVDRVSSFWLNHVVPKIPPVAVELDEARLEIQRAEGAVPRIDLSSNGQFCEVAAMLRDAKQLKAEAEILEAQAREQVLEYADGPGVYIGGDVRISYTFSRGRSSFDKKALAGAKPFDRIATSAAVLKLCGGVASDAIAALRGCELDLTAFEKQGASFAVLRVSQAGAE